MLAYNTFGNFPKLSPIMLGLFPIIRMLDYANSNYSCELCIAIAMLCAK